MQEMITPKKAKNKSGMATKKRNEIIFLICLLALPILHKCVFYLGTSIQSVLLAFETYDKATKTYYISGFGNFAQVFKNLASLPLLQTSLRNTLYLYIMETFLSIPISLLCSYFVVKKVPGHGFFKIVFFLPSILSSVVMVLMFKYFGDWAIPEIAKTLFGVKNFPLIFRDAAYAFPMMLVYSLWVGFAGGIVLYLGAMTRVPDGVTDAAMIDGVGMFGEFWHVIMPTVYPTLSVFLVTGLVGIFTGGGPIHAFYGDGVNGGTAGAPEHVYTMGYYLFTQVIGKNASNELYPYASAMGLLITLVATPLTFLLKYLLEKFGPTEE